MPNNNIEMKDVNGLSNELRIAMGSLASLQEPDGSFLSTTIPTGETVKTTYYTSLILLCIEHAPAGPEKDMVVARSVAYLKSRMSDRCTWNYLSERNTSPYPDDLDDTFLALLAIATYEPEWITPEIMVAVTNLLIACETQPGGPYYTWIVPANQRETWNDVDIVVNANICRLLNLLQIDLPPLKRYLASHISDNDLSSAFYHDKRIARYFLSKIEPVKQRPTLRELISEEGQAIPWFIEKITGGQPIYSACVALTTALMIESLCLPLQSDTSSGLSLDQEYISRLYERIQNDLSSTPLLCKRILCELEKLKTSDPSGVIRLLPLFFYQNMRHDLRDSIPESVVMDLCSAGIFGWIGFTIQDDVLDGHRNVKDLPVASSCIMHAQELFYECASAKEMMGVVSTALQGINESLMHETTSSNISLDMIGKKSLGYALGPYLLTRLAGHHHETVMEFFENFLIVRQSLDDLHDWYDDLSNGIITPVVATILDMWKLATGNEGLPQLNDRDELEKLFWDTALDRAAVPIRTHMTRAHEALERMTVLHDTTFLCRMLDRYVAALDRAVAERDKTQSFIDAYAEK